MKRITLLLLQFIVLYSFACTNLLVGKNASVSGAAYISYSVDSYGMYGRMLHFPARKHAQGEMRRIIDGDTHQYLQDIPEASETYHTMGYMNEFQLSIMESTFGGREELWQKDPRGGIDYVSLMQLGLQRAKTAREAIKVMTSLVEQYGYSSEGESFSIADPNEVWILEMIGKGDVKKGCVWVAVRIPDDCISAHANQSRIHQFNLKDKANVMYSKDVISFARQKGYFKGKDTDFSFSSAYSPADFSSQRYCDARVWSFFNHHVEGMERYLPFVDGLHIGNSTVMPLYFRPKAKLRLQDVMDDMRDHYEGTPFEFHSTAAGGIYGSPYQPTPLAWEHEGKKYFNERPISTQQASCVMVAELRSWLPNAIGGVMWFANDDANMTPFTPVYCGATAVPQCYADGTASDHEFSWESAFWVCNWVANMTYPRYRQLYPDLKKERIAIESYWLDNAAQFEKQALFILEGKGKKALGQLLTSYSNEAAQQMLTRWKKLGEYLIMKYNDQGVKKEKDGMWELTPDSICVPIERQGYPVNYRSVLIRETGKRFLQPNQK